MFAGEGPALSLGGRHGHPAWETYTTVLAAHFLDPVDRKQGSPVTFLASPLIGVLSIEQDEEHGHVSRRGTDWHDQ